MGESSQANPEILESYSQSFRECQTNEPLPGKKISLLDIQQSAKRPLFNKRVEHGFKNLIAMLGYKFLVIGKPQTENESSLTAITRCLCLQTVARFHFTSQ